MTEQMLSFEYHEFIQPLTWSPVHTKVTKDLLENFNQVGGGGGGGGAEQVQYTRRWFPADGQ